MEHTERQKRIETIRTFPERLAAVVAPLSDTELTTAYLEGEWTVAQNVHHLVDSHMNSVIRLKLILSEDNPPLRGYDQDVWARYPDATRADLSASLTILRGLHARWAVIWENVKDDEWSRVGHHSESGPISVEELLIYYSDHGEGHIHQINRTLAAR